VLSYVIEQVIFVEWTNDPSFIQEIEKRVQDGGRISQCPAANRESSLYMIYLWFQQCIV